MHVFLVRVVIGGYECNFSISHLIIKILNYAPLLLLNPHVH